VLKQKIRFQIGSKKKLKNMSYYVVGRGNILESKTVDVQDKKIGVFEFDSTFSMAPSCSLVVFYVAEDGTITSDQTQIDFAPDALPNPVG
jgi:CD109 antigen